MIECMKTAVKLPERNEEKENKKQTEHIYISGPITGTSDYMKRFEKAEKELTENGYSVINPAKVNAMPVSYTHLDVYKRQAGGFVIKTIDELGAYER